MVALNVSPRAFTDAQNRTSVTRSVYVSSMTLIARALAPLSFLYAPKSVLSSGIVERVLDPLETVRIGRSFGFSSTLGAAFSSTSSTSSSVSSFSPPASFSEIFQAAATACEGFIFINSSQTSGFLSKKHNNIGSIFHFQSHRIFNRGRYLDIFLAEQAPQSQDLQP